MTDIRWQLLAWLRHTHAVIVVQRIRVRWNADSRGSVQANQRSSLPHVFTLPAQELRGDAVVHDVLLDQASTYAPRATVAYGTEAARAAGLWLDIIGGSVTVQQLAGWQAYPIVRHQQRMFTLMPGQSGRHRSNYRFRGHCCAPKWYYEQWTTHIANTDTPDAGLFTNRDPNFDVDARVHLYGGR